jgi:hypothetical protein
MARAGQGAKYRNRIGVLNGTRLLSRKSVELMTSDQDFNSRIKQERHFYLPMLPVIGSSKRILERRKYMRAPFRKRNSRPASCY